MLTLNEKVAAFNEKMKELNQLGKSIQSDSKNFRDFFIENPNTKLTTLDEKNLNDFLKTREIHRMFKMIEKYPINTVYVSESYESDNQGGTLCYVSFSFDNSDDEYDKLAEKLSDELNTEFFSEGEIHFHDIRALYEQKHILKEVKVSSDTKTSIVKI